MAKDNRIIRSDVRIGTETFGNGREDELQEVLSPRDGARLLEVGALEGDWEFTGEEPKPLPRDGRGRLLRGQAAQLATLADTAARVANEPVKKPVTPQTPPPAKAK